jgi:broad specificity phosphatase PhoE
MSEVILVRPGYTDFDEQCRIQGLLDLPLNERGQRYVEELVEQLGGQKIDVVLTDPGEPARTTAESIGDALGVPVKDIADLRNLDLGLWQGLQLDDVRRKYPKLIKQWHEHPETICPPQGEPVCEAMSRIAQALKRPLRKYKRLVIVAADPLATLIAGMIRGTKPEFTGPMCSHAGHCIETLGDEQPTTENGAGVSAADRPFVNGQATLAPVKVTTIDEAFGAPGVNGRGPTESTTNGRVNGSVGPAFDAATVPGATVPAVTVSGARRP